MKGIYSMGDLRKKLNEHEELLKKQVYIEGGDLVINVDYEYVIALNRCDTLEKILGWATHLCEKTWMNLDVMERFIRLAAAHNKLSIPNP